MNMARRRNSGRSSGGLFGLFIIIFAIALNVGIVLLIIGAVVGLFWLLNRTFSRTEGHVTDEPVSTDTDTVATQAALAAAGSNSVALPQSNGDKLAVQAFLEKYLVDEFAFPDLKADPLHQQMETYRCLEVLQAVNRLQSDRVDTIRQMNICKKDIDEILSCPGSTGEQDQLQYLRDHEESLKCKLAAYNAGQQKLLRQRIHLIAKHGKAFSDLKQAVSLIKNSKKIECAAADISFDSFAELSAALPGDLFSSDVRPIVLNFGAYRFCILPDVILAYDKADAFVTALEPMAMVITSAEKPKSVTVTKSGYSGSWIHRDPVIAEDSVKISEGTIHTSWRYQKKNGGPDLRYRNNPMLQTRTDEYRYGTVAFRIGPYAAVYSFSACNHVGRVKQLSREYTSIMHEPNGVPALLRLLESSAKKKSIAQGLSATYEQADTESFCKMG